MKNEAFCAARALEADDDRAHKLLDHRQNEN